MLVSCSLGDMIEESRDSVAAMVVVAVVIVVRGGAAVAAAAGVVVGGGAVAAATVVAALESLRCRWRDHPSTAPVWGSETTFGGEGAVVGLNGGQVQLGSRGTSQLGHGIGSQSILGGEKPLKESLVVVEQCGVVGGSSLRLRPWVGLRADGSMLCQC